MIYYAELIAAQYFYVQGLSATTQDLDDSMACGQSNCVMIQAEVSALARELDDDIMVGCYNDEMTKKAIMQIGR